MNEENDEQLMELVSSGDKQALTKLYDRYYRKLTYFVNGYTNDIHAAQDIVQDIFVKIIEKPRAFDVNRKFSTWIYTLAMNAGKNNVRNETNRARILKQLAGGETVNPPDNVSKDQSLLSTRINALLSTVSAKENTVYILRFVEGLSIAEISQIMEIPAGSVKSCIYYLLKKFESQLTIFQ